MQVVLITLGILGFGAVVISVYVFMVAARSYVHERAEGHGSGDRIQGEERLWVTRSGRERRQVGNVVFPLELHDGIKVLQDRRRGERRDARA